MSLAHRKQCLWDLKEIGYQVGCGFMVGSPGQTVETLYEDLQFIRELQPHMVGIGPFISQKDTPFADKASGTMEQTLKLLAIIRLIHPHVLLPATTALGTIHPKGGNSAFCPGRMWSCRTFRRSMSGKNTSFTTTKSVRAMKPLNVVTVWKTV